VLELGKISEKKGKKIWGRKDKGEDRDCGLKVHNSDCQSTPGQLYPEKNSPKRGFAERKPGSRAEAAKAVSKKGKALS